jgi:hypothetical protein
MTTKNPGERLGSMIRLSITYFYNIATTLRPLASLTPGPLSLWWSPLFSAQTALQNLFATDWFGPAIQNSYDSGQRLLRATKYLTDQDYSTYQITALDAYAITDSLNEFETVIRAELSNADCYYVTIKGGYSTTLLVTNAERMFPSALPVKVPAAIPDIREAGKCLGYEASTAAGFHVFRALESVVRAYWDAVAKEKPHPRQKTLGGYLKQLKDHNLGDAKVRAVLQQIKDLHRNPIAHPGDTLTLDQAISLFGIAHSAIEALLTAIPIPPAPSPLGLAALPASL